jgi:hypothetical protein
MENQYQSSETSKLSRKMLMKNQVRLKRERQEADREAARNWMNL